MRYVLTLIVVSLFTLILPLSVSAAPRLQRGDNIVLKSDETVDGNYFAAGGTVVVSGNIQGDAYIAGGTITVEGNIEGDLLAAGGTVNIRGKVGQNVRVIGGSVTIAGEIGRNVAIGAGTVTITDSAQIPGSVAAGAGNFSLYAPVGKDLAVAGGDVTLGSTVAGDVRVGAETLQLSSGAKIDGDLTYWSKEEAKVDSGATVAGGITRREVKPELRDREWERRHPLQEIKDKIVTKLRILSFLAALLTGLLLTWLAPNFMQKTSDKILTTPAKSVLIGFLAFIVTPMAVSVLLATIIGIPIALTLGAVYLIALYISKLFTAYAIGALTLKWLDRKAGIFWVFTLGIVIFSLLRLIPVIGSIVYGLAVLFGLGALLLQKYDYYHLFREKKMI